MKAKGIIKVTKCAEDKIFRVLELMVDYANKLRKIPEKHRGDLRLPNDLMRLAGNTLLKPHGLWVVGFSYPSSLVGTFTVEIMRVGDVFGGPTATFSKRNN